MSFCFYRDGDYLCKWLSETKDIVGRATSVRSYYPQ